jgi:hypothetical protein
MIEYKGYIIEEGISLDGGKIYRALINSNSALVSNKSLAIIVSIIDNEVK